MSERLQFWALLQFALTGEGCVTGKDGSVIVLEDNSGDYSAP